MYSWRGDSMTKQVWGQLLEKKYPPSEPCCCDICINFCMRPGWWTVEQAAKAMESGYSKHMMLEIAPDLTFGVLSPAFKGCEGKIALNEYAKNGCNFLKNNLCELHNTSIMPLECRFCHHDKIGMGRQCHLDIEKDWHTSQGQRLVRRWQNLMRWNSIAY